MLGWILHEAGRDPTIMNGAVMKNFVSPEAPFASARVGQGPVFVSEVDESDGSIALYRPAVAVLLNVSLDHKEMDELRALFGDFLAASPDARRSISTMPRARALADARRRTSSPSGSTRRRAHIGQRAGQHARAPTNQPRR